MNWNTWKAHFEANATRPLPDVTPPQLHDEARQALGESLAKFQLGESGEGRVAHEIDRAHLPNIDGDYRAALKRFVAEEGRHARILGLMVNQVGAKTLSRQWGERLFTGVRRALGIRFKLLVLLAAEVIGISFYGLLGSRLPDSGLSRALGEICADEEAHLHFHCDFFKSQGRSAWWLKLLWWPLGIAASIAVLADHRRTLKALHIPLTEAWSRLWAPR